MKTILSAGFIVILLIACIPVVYLSYVYPSLPATVPLHFNIYGEADRFGDKNDIWFPVLLLSVISVLVYVLVHNLPKIDPKKTAGRSPDLYHKIAFTIALFMAAINLVIIYSAKTGSFRFSKLLLPLMGLFFAVLGNYMHSIKPNYFIGFRTPWTLENEDNWRKTHQLVGKLWVPGGLLLTIASLVLPDKAGAIVFFVVLATLVLVPAVYSYLYYRKNQ